MAVTLGIDIGTTKVAAVVYDTVRKNILSCASQNSKADIPAPDLHSEQSPEKIMDAVDAVINALEPEAKELVTAIGVTGQMHGVILWNTVETSSLITWKDKRASALDRFEAINRIPGAENLKDGFGTTTLACMAMDDQLNNWKFAATIHDYLVYRMCGLSVPVTDPGNAASWGCFDILEKKWNSSAIKNLNIPACLFPAIMPTKSTAGQLSGEFAAKWRLQAGLPVATALGDNQASILSTATSPADEIYLTIGTGAQLTIITSREKVKNADNAKTMEFRPYLDDEYLAVAAPLCGGQAFAWLADTVIDWQQALGLPVTSEEQLFRQLDAVGMECIDTELVVKPNFSGERHAPELSGQIENITLENFSLGNLSAALARGIVDNLKQMMPEALTMDKKIIIGSGNAIRRLEIVRHMIRQQFGLPLEVKTSKEEAACGAAILAGMQKSSPKKRF